MYNICTGIPVGHLFNIYFTHIHTTHKHEACYNTGSKHRCERTYTCIRSGFHNKPDHTQSTHRPGHNTSTLYTGSMSEIRSYSVFT